MEVVLEAMHKNQSFMRVMASKQDETIKSLVQQDGQRIVQLSALKGKLEDASNNAREAGVKWPRKEEKHGWDVAGDVLEGMEKQQRLQ